MFLVRRSEVSSREIIYFIWGSTDLLAVSYSSDILKVRVPEERIKMYTEWTIPPNKYPKHYPDGLHKTAGPFDIALIKMRVGVTLIPGRVVPVGEIFSTLASSCFTCALCRLA